MSAKTAQLQVCNRGWKLDGVDVSCIRRVSDVSVSTCACLDNKWRYTDRPLSPMRTSMMKEPETSRRSLHVTNIISRTLMDRLIMYELKAPE